MGGVVRESPAQYRVETKYISGPPEPPGGDYYDEDDYIPPAVPSKVSYGSVSSSSHTPEIAGPQYRTASPTYGLDSGYPARPQAPPPPPQVPQPVSSKLMFTSMTSPGYIESHPTSDAGSGGAPTQPPLYNKQSDFSRSQQPYMPPGAQQKYTSSAHITPQTGLYDYSLDPQGAAPGGDHGSEDKKEAEVDALTQMLMQNMEAAADPDFFGKLHLFSLFFLLLKSRCYVRATNT